MRRDWGVIPASLSSDTTPYKRVSQRNLRDTTRKQGKRTWYPLCDTIWKKDFAIGEHLQVGHEGHIEIIGSGDVKRIGANRIG